MALFGEERDRGLGEKWFGDRQHPVEVENHSSKLGVFHARAIVFDLDGVLVDTMPAISAAWAEWAGARGLPSDEVLSSLHLTATELIQKFAPELDPGVEARAIAVRQSMLESTVAAFPGSRELIGRLPRDAWAIVTSARRELAVHHLEMAQLPPPEFLISAEDTPRGKPDPAGYRLAAERLDALAGECLAIEDSPAGIRAARDAGMFVLGVTNTHAPAELRGAHAIIASLMRLDVSANPLQDVRRVRVRWKDGIEDLQDPA